MTTRIEPAASCNCTGVITVSIGAALVVALLLLAPGAPLDALAPMLAVDGAPPPGPAADSMHAGVDWKRVEQAAPSAGASVAAYECPPER